MKIITIGGKPVLVDDEDYERVIRFRWYLTRDDRVQRAETLHRFILQYVGPLTVDHIDGNTLNNQKANLEIISQEENTRRRFIRENEEKGRFLGTSQRTDTKLWQAYVDKPGKRIHLGNYKTREEAVNVRERFLKTGVMPKKYRYRSEDDPNNGIFD